MSKKIDYVWGGNTYSVPAPVVGKAVHRIVRRYGRCEPEELVKAAEPEASPLHPLFDWDDKTAAGKWRNHQARNILRSIVIREERPEGESFERPAFVSVGHVAATQDAGGGYRPIDVVMADERFAEEAMREAMMHLRAFRRRYESLSALNPVWEAMEKVQAAD